MNRDGSGGRGRALAALRALVPAVLIVLFGLFLHSDRVLALVLLALAMGMVLRWVWRTDETDARRVFGLQSCGWAWYAGGALAAVALAALQRNQNGLSLAPVALTPFLPMAVLIGGTEELLFRGYFLGRLLELQRPLAANAAATGLHAAYKVALFALAGDPQLLLLGGLTFLVGLLIGWTRIASHSVWPCVFAHALFDLWAYADRLTPWWVW